MVQRLQLGLDDARPGGGYGAPGALRGDYQIDVGGVLRQSFSVTLANLGSFVLMGLVVYSPALLVYLVAAVAPMDRTTATLVTLLAALVKGLLTLVLTGALAYGVINQLRGRPAGVGETIKVGLGSLGRVFLVSFVVGIMTLVGYVLCIVPGVIVTCMNWVAVPVAVAENRGVRLSLERSQELTEGTRMGVFAVILVIGLITGVVGAVLGATAQSMAAAFSGSKTIEGPALALMQLGVTLLEMPFECLQAVSVAVGYHDLRVNREGADVDDLVRVFE